MASEWQLVARKRRRSEGDAFGRQQRMDRSGVMYGARNANEVSFFFSQFPEDHGVKEMLRIFSLYGKATEVVIPPKRDKLGRRFGFVRFTEVRDPEYFATKLDNIIIGATKIHANIPRYSRDTLRKKHALNATRSEFMGRKEGKTPSAEKGEDTKGKGKVHEVEADGKREAERSRRREDGQKNKPVVKNHTRRNEVSQCFKSDGWRWNRRKGGRFGGDEHKGLLCYDVTEEEMSRFRKMYVGYVKQLGTSYRVQDWFSVQGVSSVKITPLGANSVLLEDIEEGMLDALISDAKSGCLNGLKT